MVCASCGTGTCASASSATISRAGPGPYDESIARPHVREMDFSGRPMRDMVYFVPEGCAEDDDLSQWLELALGFVRTLPPKH